MLELTTLIIFTWLTLRVRYFHIYLKNLVVFDLNISNYGLIRWISSFIMTSDPTNYQGTMRSPINTLDAHQSMTHERRTKMDLCMLSGAPLPSNRMQFIEVFPSDRSIQPHPRSGHRAIATESDFWMWGGYYPGDEVNPERMFEELWRYNFALRRWTLESTTGDRPLQTLASHSMCRRGNFLLVFGGTGFPFGRHVSNDLYVLDLKRLHWRQCELSNQQPQRVYGASMIVHDDYVYILCGTDSWIYHSDIYAIHLPTMKCTHIGHTFNEIEEVDISGRYRQEACLHNNKIYLFGGGGVSGISYSLENLPVFDLATNQWSFIQTNPDPVHNFPTGRKFHSVFPFHQNQVVVFGGAHYNTTTQRHSVINERLWTFNFDQLEWSMLPSLSMLEPTYFHAAAMNDRGEIWMHGGIVGGSSSNDHDFNVQEKRTTKLYTMQTRVLNLSELTWNRFLNSLSDRFCLIEQPDLLVQLGVPPRFIERIH